MWITSYLSTISLSLSLSVYNLGPKLWKSPYMAMPLLLVMWISIFFPYAQKYCLTRARGYIILSLGGYHMSIIIPPITDIATKWKTVTPTRVADYEYGIRNPRASWVMQTSKAAQAWVNAMQLPSTWSRWGLGVAKCGDDGWQDAAIAKGVPRWAQGVGASGNKYQDGFAPYRDCIANLTLPPRGPAGAPGNLERVRIVAEALHNLKISGK